MVKALLSMLLAAATPAAGVFTIDGQRFAAEQILDARALPQLDGHATIMVTFNPAAAKRLETLTKAKVGKSVAIALDGKTLMTAPVTQPIDSGTVEIGGAMTLPQAEATAKRISGKDPVPEEFED